MRLFILLRAVFMKAVIAALLLLGVFISAGASLAQTTTVRCPATGILLPTVKDGDDLLIDGTSDGSTPLPGDGKCHVGDGTYHYGNVNIITTPPAIRGTLSFDEGPLNTRIHFWASSILVEYGGSLIAGSPTPAGAFGANLGVLTIHLYGADQGKSGVGVICRSNNSAINPPCGIPGGVWTNNGAPVGLPGGSLGTQYTDNFYQYQPLPFDDKVDSTTNAVGYFGYKVLAVSEGGTLQLFGSKGATYGASLGPQMTGMSWVRLQWDDPRQRPRARARGDDAHGRSTPVDWKEGDHIVVTTTDYLPGHSEELVICGDPVGNTINFTTLEGTCAEGKVGVQWTHYGEQYPLPMGNPTGKTTAETRAAVGLLTRSIRIVSEGDTVCNTANCTTATFLQLLNLIRFRAIILAAIRSCGKGSRRSRSRESSFVSWDREAKSATIPFTCIWCARRLKALTLQAPT